MFLQRIVLRMEDGKERVLEEGSQSAVEESGTRVGKRSSATKLAGGPVTVTQLLSDENLSSQSLAGGMPTTPQLPQPGQLSLVVASVVHGGTSSLVPMLASAQQHQQQQQKSPREAKRGGVTRSVQVIDQIIIQWNLQ